MNYWQSWQDHSDWDRTRKYMRDDFKFDAGAFQTDTADQLIEMMKNGNPWKEIMLLDMVVNHNKGALFYEGIDSVNDAKFRIAEIITVEEDKVASCIATITQLPAGDH